MSDIASLLSGISQSIQSCHDCGHQFAVVEIVGPMKHGNLIPYPAVGLPEYCARCGRHMRKRAVKQIGAGEKQSKAINRRRFAGNRRYTTQEAIDILGYKSRATLSEARSSGALPFRNEGFRITYLGADLARWAKTL